MNIILFDDSHRDNLLPLCFTRPVAELRTGVITIREKWEHRLRGAYSWHTVDYLRDKFPQEITVDNLLISAHVCPTNSLVERVKILKPGEGIRWQGHPVALLIEQAVDFDLELLDGKVTWIDFEGELDYVEFPWDLVRMNARQIQLDFDLLTSGRESEPISLTNQLIHPENIFVEPGVKMECCTINASEGPVYIGADAEVMEGALIRGPFSLGERAVVNMGTRIYGGTTVGPYSKVGGELSQSILIGYSNKGHDGFLGHSVLGEWCNLGAGTNVSNLKNTYDQVKVWNYPSGRFIRSGLQFGGLIMGDHSKAGLNSMFNTGTVVGVACNIHGSGFPRQFVPSFADGGVAGFKQHQLKSVFTTAKRVMERRQLALTELDEQILTAVFERTAAFRRF